ncbi:HAD family hydrolase [Microbacterium betulae]|uniref:HAD family hydrolase n=1 Tax=Microbacterium betulae TaxID=2981139 RepID=A0AA97I6W3_9MICO|nr:HAD family hydrolase [Microbacterium sp. AB]WOF22815.1 HAD family hydrolase [Microbacterium sp. AB]
MTRRRIVFLDIDGTIIDHDGRIPASAENAIRTARSNGHIVLLSTGRSPLEVDDRLHAIGLDGEVTSAGAFVRMGEEWVVERLMPEPKARRMIAVFEELGLDYTLQGRDAVYPTPGQRERLRRLLELDGRADLAHMRRGIGRHLQDAGAAPLDRIAKAVFASDRLDAFEAVGRELGDEGFSVITGTIPHLGTAGGEVSPAGVNKGTAILLLLDRLGVDAADSIGIGDNNNDLEMLRAVGLGIAMGNGTPEAKEAADEETEAVGDDGLAKAFARHGLI